MIKPVFRLVMRHPGLVNLLIRSKTVVVGED